MKPRLAPTFLPFPRPPALLAIDDAAKTVTRYMRKPAGAGGGFLATQAKINPPETMNVLGEKDALAMLEDFRKTGRVE